VADSANRSPLIASSQWRFTLKQLFIWMALIALGCVALRSANPTWVSAMFGLTLLALGASLLFALYRDGIDRAYWIGFATIGWLYVLVLLYGWSLDPNTGTYWSNPLQPQGLVTTSLSVKCFAWMYPPQIVTQPMGPAMGSGMYGGSGMMPMGGGNSAGGMSGSSAAMMGSAGGMPGMPGGFATFTVPAPGPSQQDFTNVAHALWTLLLAACGGWLAMWLYATRSRSSDRQQA